MTRRNPTVSSFWRDERVLRLFGQVIFLLVFGALTYVLISNMVGALNKQGIALGFSFLEQTAGFDLSEALIRYTRSDTYLRAVIAGMLNTLLVSLLGIIFATLLGLVIGVAQLSSNFLVGRIAKGYVELMRNIPLLVLLVFWYSGVFLQLPRVRQATQLPGPVFLSNRGLAIPWLQPTESFRTYVVVLIVSLLVAIGVAVLLRQRGRRTGRMPLVTLWSVLGFLVVAAAGWLVLPLSPLRLSLPSLSGTSLRGGLVVSPEFMALLTGLVLYTSAFIGEVVRSGIQSVPKGQIEAAQALGLNPFKTLRLVVLPLALRVIIPPLTGQYLNLTKNSSLGVAIGYPDLFKVSGTVINQSGRAVEMISIVMLIYLAISLLTSAFMNWYNRRVRLVER